MAKDKYSAVWLSHSSINEFLRCPRAYFLRYVYKDPVTGNRINIIKPPLALGQAVHKVIDDISRLPADKRLKIPLADRFEQVWAKVEGKKGGFRDKKEEEKFWRRGIKMVEKIEENPGPVLKRAIKIKKDLPYYWISEEDNLILCGKIDWLEYVEEDDSVHIIDFKTGENEEPEDSLQLPIYVSLATSVQKRPVTKASYWYLENQDSPQAADLPDIAKSEAKIIEVGKRMKLGRQIDHLKCPRGGCFACRDLERIVAGEGELVGRSEYGQDIYFLSD